MATVTTSDPTRPRVRLVIVEDHELVAGTLALALREQGLEVETTSGPSMQAVIDTVARLAPDLVLLDLELGDGLGSGVDLVRPLTEAGTAVVIMTGVTERARLAECIEAGAKGIVSKAGGFEDLVDAVWRFIHGEAILAENQRQELLAELRARRSADRERLRPFEALTAREQSVLEGLMAGDSAETIAARSYVSLATVRSQIQSVLRKLGVNSQLAAVALARDAGWPGH
jgi:DNA-binding NarL/FixJ family response regulator